jgi:hypothetical protein
VAQQFQTFTGPAAPPPTADAGSPPGIDGVAPAGVAGEPSAYPGMAPAYPGFAGGPWGAPVPGPGIPAGASAAPGLPPGAPSGVPPGFPSGAGVPGMPPAAYGAPAGYFPMPLAYGLPGMPQPYDQLGMLAQALRQHQIPPLPGLAPYATPAAPQADGLGLLRMILGNPHFQQALHFASVLGPAAPRTMQLPVPSTAAAAPGVRPVAIPLGAVMNTIAELAGQSMVELNASTSEDDPEVPAYLVDDQGQFIVDPGNAQDRAGLVVHLFRMNDEAQRSGLLGPSGPVPEADAEQDESDRWAREAGFSM